MTPCIIFEKQHHIFVESHRAFVIRNQIIEKLFPWRKSLNFEVVITYYQILHWFVRPLQIKIELFLPLLNKLCTCFNWILKTHDFNQFFSLDSCREKHIWFVFILWITWDNKSIFRPQTFQLVFFLHFVREFKLWR